MRVNWTQKSIHAVVGKRSEKRRRPKMRRERDREWWKVREGWTEERRGNDRAISSSVASSLAEMHECT